jgi:hypothetical protein
MTPDKPGRSRLAAAALALLWLAGGVDTALQRLHAPTFVAAASAKDGGGDGGGGHDSGGGSGGGSGSRGGSDSEAGSGGGGHGSDDGASGGSDEGGSSGTSGSSARGGSDDGGRSSRNEQRDVERFLDRLGKRNRVTWSRHDGDAISVRYSDGWMESVSQGRYRLTDKRDRLVTERAARRSDLKRLRAAASR